MEEEYKGFTITIEQNDGFDDDSPRQWDNLGTMVCFAKRYRLGDKNSLEISDFNSWKEMEQRLIKEEHAVLIFPLYMYDHSIQRIKIGSFNGLLPQGHAEFDSGMIGFIYVTREKLLKEYGGKRITKAMKEKAEKVLRSEVEVYDQYISGDVWMYSISRNNKVIDSLTNMYGYKYAIEQAENAVDSTIKSEQRQHFSKLRTWITKHVPLDKRTPFPTFII